MGQHGSGSASEVCGLLPCPFPNAPVFKAKTGTTFCSMEFKHHVSVTWRGFRCFRRDPHLCMCVYMCLCSVECERACPSWTSWLYKTAWAPPSPSDPTPPSLFTPGHTYQAPAAQLSPVVTPAPPPVVCREPVLQVAPSSCLAGLTPHKNQVLGRFCGPVCEKGLSQSF